MQANEYIESRFPDFRPRGSDEYWVHCPFCPGRVGKVDYRHKLYINLQRMWVYCPRCCYSSSVYWFARSYDNTSLTGVERRDNRPSGIFGSKMPQREDLAPQAIEIPEFRLLDGDDALYARGLRSYLYERDFGDDLISRRMVGYSMDSMLYGRIIFPFLLGGEIVSYTGRLIDGKGKKYLNASVRLPNYLYNMDEALPYNSVVLVEGPFDVLDEDYVALMGSGFNKGIMSTIVKYWDSITIALDGDALFKSATIATALCKADFPTRIVVLPKDSDPSSMGLEAMTELVDEAQWVNRLSLLELKLSTLPKR